MFSGSFARARSPTLAYGSNLLGAVFGGMLEHASLAFGIRTLSALALALYAGAPLAARPPSASVEGAK